MGREIVLGLHFYQPPREAVHPSLSTISTDPERKNWTAIIEKQCYEPLASEGLLNKISFDIYQTLLLQLEKLDPGTALVYQRSMKENGIGESFIHPILPDLSHTDKSIVIAAGVNRFKEVTGQNPKIFWPPETAIDTETLEVLSDYGYQGFVCAPEQIQLSHGSSDNQPTIIELSKGKRLIAYPFDRPISSRLAFDPKQNADNFANTFIKPRRDQSSDKQILIAWTDAETFGHHYRNGDKFLEFLLESSLPGLGLFPVSINNIDLDLNNLPHGKIIERSAWSCPHGNLVRWNGSCDCYVGQDTTWKQPFVSAMSYLNDRVSKILEKEIGRNYPELVSAAFYDHLAHPDVVNDPVKALTSAKISSLIAKTSCATFFGDPGVSGKINLLYAYQSLLYLNDAGLGRTASDVKSTFFEKLTRVSYPYGRGNALNALEEMLRS